MFGGGGGSKTSELSHSEKDTVFTLGIKKVQSISVFKKQILHFVQGCTLKTQGKMSDS